ncbi:MAG: hypothetical protein JJE27_00510 [Thermoleophilia bacterium]|nr:hypothetical protein [Thermoleophilia bacterium]
MSSRGGRVPAPPTGEQWDLRFANKKAARNWELLCNTAATNCAEMHARLSADPRKVFNADRHHRLKGELSTGAYGGLTLEQWQYEITGSGRVWFLIDDNNRKVWLTAVESGHPSKTDK